MSFQSDWDSDSEIGEIDGRLRSARLLVRSSHVVKCRLNLSHVVHHSLHLHVTLLSDKGLRLQVFVHILQATMPVSPQTNHLWLESAVPVCLDTSGSQTTHYTTGNAYELDWI